MRAFRLLSMGVILTLLASSAIPHDHIALSQSESSPCTATVNSSHILQNVIDRAQGGAVICLGAE